jgi:hypothetical protein
MDISDRTSELVRGRTTAQTADFLCRDKYEARQKPRELGRVDGPRFDAYCRSGSERYDTLFQRFPPKVRAVQLQPVGMRGGSGEIDEDGNARPERNYGEVSLACSLEWRAVERMMAATSRSSRTNPS